MSDKTDSKKTNIHGSIYLNGGRYWWKVKLPGEACRKDYPLTPIGSTLPTKSRSVAEEIARLRWKKAYVESGADQSSQAAGSESPLDNGIIDDGTVASLIESYKAYAKKRYVHPDGSSTGQYEKISYILSYFEIFEAMKIEDVTAKLLEDWMVGLTKKSQSDERNEREKPLGLCRTLANCSMREVRRMFKWGVKRGRVPDNVYWQLTLVEGLRRGQYGARESKDVTSIDPEYVERTLPYCPEVVADMLRIQLLTGMRPGEVRMMRVCDIDMSHREQNVWIYRPAWHKTDVDNKDRLIPLGPQAQEIVAKYLNRPVNQFLFSPADAVSAMRDRRSRDRETPLNEGNRPGMNKKESPQRTPGEQYAETAYGRAVTRAIEKANHHLKKDEAPIPHWHPYQIRHTVANMVEREYGEKAAQNYLGHASLETTRRHYLERDLKQAVEVSQKIG
jgi:integrase